MNTSTLEKELLLRVREIGHDVVAPLASEIDVLARFPSEAIAALREERALSILVPSDLGGAGTSLGVVASLCFELARHCGSTAMVFAMHQIQVATLASHARPVPWFEDYLRSVALEQRLIGSVTSEIGNGGDLGRSVAALVPTAPGVVSFEKQAPTVSYGAQADDLLTTLRRDPEAAPVDQVLALSLRGQHQLEQRSTWDPLGMRGTCSPGFTVRAELPAAQVMTAPFASISATTMVPVAHLLWSHVWLGIATDAFDRARALVRGSAKQSAGNLPPTARRLSDLLTDLMLMRAEVEAALRYFSERSEVDRATPAGAVRFNNLKIAASQQAPRVCLGALGICGVAGYKNDTPYSVGRHLRDALSGALMVSNERIHESNAGLLLVAKDV